MLARTPKSGKNKVLLAQALVLPSAPAELVAAEAMCRALADDRNEAGRRYSKIVDRREREKLSIEQERLDGQAAAVQTELNRLTAAEQVAVADRNRHRQAYQ